MLPRRYMAVLLAAPLLATTACGNAKRLQPSDRAVKVSLPAVQATINPAPPSSASPTKAPASAAPSAPGSAPASGSGASPAPAGGGTEVKTSAEIKFVPGDLQVKVGTEVSFTNAGGGPHTVTGGAGSPDPNSPIGNGPLSTEGATIKVKFDKPGTYPYYCIPHESLGMKGQVVVS